MSIVHRIYRGFRRILAAALILPGLVAWMTFLSCFTTYPWRLYHWLGTDEYDLGTDPRYIVVMGGGEMPGESGLMRTHLGARVGRRFTNATLIVAYPVEGKFETGDAAQMQAELVMRGIAPERIRIEPVGRNTREQALNIRRMLGRETIEAPVLVVTSPEHLKRSLWTFRKAGFEQVAGVTAITDSLEAAPAGDVEELGRQPGLPQGPDMKTRLRYVFWNQLAYLNYSLRELAALGYYWARGWI